MLESRSKSEDCGHCKVSVVLKLYISFYFIFYISLAIRTSGVSATMRLRLTSQRRTRCNYETAHYAHVHHKP